MRGHPFRDHRTGDRRRLLSLHALPASHRHRRLSASANRRAHAASAPRSGPAQVLAPPEWRTREVLLRRVRLTPVQSQPPEPHLCERAHGRLRRGPRRETLMALIRRLRCALGANPRGRPRTTTRGQASNATIRGAIVARAGNDRRQPRLRIIAPPRSRPTASVKARQASSAPQRIGHTPNPEYRHEKCRQWTG